MLNVVSSFGKRTFTLSEVYGYEAHFIALHPDNHRVREKIRQQLQVLRDLECISKRKCRVKFMPASEPQQGTRKFDGRQVAICPLIVAHENGAAPR